MKLTEITIPFQRNEIAKKLISAGYNQIGTGSYGDVYKKPGTSFVLKIFEIYDEAYLKFISLVKSHPNPHFPIFYSNLIKLSDNYYAIRMEQLEEYPESRFESEFKYIWNYVYSAGKNLNDMPNLDKSFIPWMSQHPHIKQACDLIIRHVGQFSFDMKINNVMLRDNTLVFIDPFY